MYSVTYKTNNDNDNTNYFTICVFDLVDPEVRLSSSRLRVIKDPVQSAERQISHEYKAATA